MPSQHRWYAESSPERLMCLGRALGPNVEAVIAAEIGIIPPHAGRLLRDFVADLDATGASTITIKAGPGMGAAARPRPVEFGVDAANDRRVGASPGT